MQIAYYMVYGFVNLYFLAVQDGSIGDLVTHSVTHLLILVSSEQCRAVGANYQ